MKENMSEELRHKVLFKCSLHNSADKSSSAVAINRNELARKQFEICCEHNKNHYTANLQTSKFVKVSDNVQLLANNYALKKNNDENLNMRN